jgi:hypothetical protein
VVNSVVSIGVAPSLRNFKAVACPGAQLAPEWLTSTHSTLCVCNGTWVACAHQHLLKCFHTSSPRTVASRTATVLSTLKLRGWPQKP